MRFESAVFGSPIIDEILTLDFVKFSLRFGIISLVLGTIFVGIGFAAYTNHVWEDYYITFRSSQNLVEGNGLVFNPGERVHTFTSPLGVLLPALASLLTGRDSTVAALWLFRMMSLAALAGAAVLLVQIARRWKVPSAVAGAAGVLLVIDGKSMDFAINGMETSFLILSILYALWSHLKGVGGVEASGSGLGFDDVGTTGLFHLYIAPRIGRVVVRHHGRTRESQGSDCGVVEGGCAHNRSLSAMVHLGVDVLRHAGASHRSGKEWFN